VEGNLSTSFKDFPVKVMDSSLTTGLLAGRIMDKGRMRMEEIYDAMYKWTNANIDTSILSFNLTGPDFLTDIGHRLRIKNMYDSFLLEILIVSLLIGVIYRSFLLVLITFIANFLPVLFIAGVMGFMGIELRGTTTIVFAIGYVIAVDDTLHFINRFQLEKRKGFSTADALRTTVMYTGRAMVSTSLILLGGFLILLHSSFGDVYTHGFLVSLIILTALITELFLTPVLVTYFFNDKKQHAGSPINHSKSFLPSEQGL
jgi:predicted RND superfamily exporter protein